MRRIEQLLFVGCLAALSWLGMMAVHELGHVVGAWVSGGRVEQVVLDPLTISRTDVSANRHPALVAWSGPVVGCLLPLALVAATPRRWSVLRGCLSFFAGFCLIANGAYIALGAWGGVGDSGEMLRAGSPFWTLCAFGALAAPTGLLLWHRMGSLEEFLGDPTIVTRAMTLCALAALAVLLALEFALSAR